MSANNKKKPESIELLEGKKYESEVSLEGKKRKSEGSLGAKKLTLFIVVSVVLGCALAALTIWLGTF